MEKKFIYQLLFILLCLALPLFYWGDPDYYSPRLLKEVWNFGHLVFFLFFAVLLDERLITQRKTVLYRTITIFTTVALLALVTELSQTITESRSFSSVDLARDMSGGVIVILWHVVHTSSLRLLLLKTMAMVIIAVNIFPVLQIAINEYRAYRDFPVLVSIESNRHLYCEGGCQR